MPHNSALSTQHSALSGVRHGGRPRTVTDDQIAEIRRLSAAGNRTQQIMEATGVKRSTVQHYCRTSDDYVPLSERDTVSALAHVDIRATPSDRGWSARIYTTDSKGMKGTPVSLAASSLSALLTELADWAREARLGEPVIVHPEMGDRRPRERRHVYRDPVCLGVHSC